MENKMPELKNPMMNIMMNGFSGMPQVIEKSMPVATPQLKYNSGPIKMFVHNYKVERIAKASENERKIAENSLATVKAKFEAIHEVLTFSAKVADTLGDYEHRKTMRAMEIQEKQSDIYIKQAQAQVVGYEAKLAELDYNMKIEQYNEMRRGR